MRTLLAALALALSLPALAHADQCALVDKKVAADALALVKASGSVVELCEPCGDRAPGKPLPATTVTSTGDGLVAGTRGLDLAYTYVKTGPKEWRNLAIATGCPATGVSEYVRDGRPSGPVKDLASPFGKRVPGRPPLPPRASSPDELVGTWSVRVTPWLSSCPARPSKGDETWNIDLQAGTFTIATSDNLVFEGPAATLTHGMLTHSLRTRQLPSSTVVKVTQSARDRFYATIIRGEPQGGPNDPFCVMQLNVSGQRKP